MIVMLIGTSDESRAANIMAKLALPKSPYMIYKKLKLIPINDIGSFLAPAAYNKTITVYIKYFHYYGLTVIIHFHEYLNLILSIVHTDMSSDIGVLCFLLSK